MTPTSIAYRLDAFAPAQHSCPAGCTLPDMIRCWRGLERRLRADLMTATMSGSPDAEVVRGDLRVAEERIDTLLARALGWAA
jgi:hypothetical protein